MKKRANLGGDSVGCTASEYISYVRRFLLRHFITMDWIYNAQLYNSWWLFGDSGGKPIKIKSDTSLYTAVEANVITCNCFHIDISAFSLLRPKDTW